MSEHAKTEGAAELGPAYTIVVHRSDTIHFPRTVDVPSGPSHDDVIIPVPVELVPALLALFTPPPANGNGRVVHAQVTVTVHTPEGPELMIGDPAALKVCSCREIDPA